MTLRCNLKGTPSRALPSPEPRSQSGKERERADVKRTDAADVHLARCRHSMLRVAAAAGARPNPTYQVCRHDAVKKGNVCHGYAPRGSSGEHIATCLSLMAVSLAT